MIAPNLELLELRGGKDIRTQVQVLIVLDYDGFDGRVETPSSALGAE